MNRVDRHVRGFNDLGDYTVGDVKRAGLLPTWGTPDRWFMPACVNFKFGVRCPCNTLEENRLKRCGLVVRPTGRLGPHAATVTMLQQILLAGNEFSDYNPEGFGRAT